MRAYPFESIPAGKYSESFERFKRDNEMQATAFRRYNDAQPVGSKLTGTTWTPLAPKNFAGRILCLAFHPTNQNIIWAGSASGGLWKTTNGGTGASNGINWINVPTGFNTLGIMSIAIDNSNPNVMYVGTGEVYNIPGDYGGRFERVFRGTYGIGILKSTDGGTTFTKSLDFSLSDLKGVADILIHPTIPSTVFAATTDGVYRSTDAGNSWTLIHNITMAQDLCFKPDNPNVLYVGSGGFGSAGHGIYKTTNANAASPSFTKLTGGLPAAFSGMVRLHISAANTNKVFASIGKAPGTTDPNGLYVSNDDGVSWAKVNTTDYINNQGWFAHDVVVDPTNTNNVYVAEMDIWRSTNGGATITQSSFWNQWDFNNTTVGATLEGTANTYVHADIHHLYISPFSNNTIFVACDGGVFKSTNSGASYIGLNGGLQTAQIYANMGISATNPNFMIMGLQDNATFIYTGNPGCRRRIGGDGFSAVIDHTNDNICFGTLYFNTVYRSTDGGNNFSVRINNSSNTEFACFSSPLVMARSNRLVMYSATHKVKKSVDNGITWTNVNGNAALVSGNRNPVITLAVAPTNENIVLAATVPGSGNRSKLFKSTNGGTSFTEITGSLPDRYYSDIAFDPTNANRFVVTLAGYNSSHIFLTTDGGNSWTDIGAGLPNVPHNAVIFDPSNSQTIIVGNDLGVYVARRVTNGATQPVWTPYNEGFIDATLIVDLAVTNTGMLRVGTHGKGLWERNMPPITLPVTIVNWSGSCTSGNKLEWLASQETEMKQYEIESSEDGIHFSHLKTIKARNNSTGTEVYQYTDPPKSTNKKLFYRLKIVHTNNSYYYSEIIALNCNNNPNRGIQITPNPSDGYFRIQMPVNTETFTADIRVVNSNGQLIYSTRKQVSTGNNQIAIDLRFTAPGVYTCLITGPQLNFTGKLVKQ